VMNPELKGGVTLVCVSPAGGRKCYSYSDVKHGVGNHCVKIIQPKLIGVIITLSFVPCVTNDD